MKKAISLAAGSGMVLLLGAFAGVASAKADTVTDVNISSYYSANWNSPSFNNGAAIASASTSGNTGSGLTFGDWMGAFVRFPNSTSSSLSVETLNLGSIALNSNATVNTLFNTIYGTSAVQATISFMNSAGATASYDLVGNQTIRDYNDGTNTNGLSGTGVGVTALNWWNDGSGPDTQRLDAQIFTLPASWNGTNLVSMSVTNPTLMQNNPALSALQVDVRAGTGPSTVPEPSSLMLLGSGMLALVEVGWRRVVRG